MTKINERLLLFVFHLLPVCMMAQAPTPVVEYTVHYGDYGDGEDLTGYVTYDVFLEFPSSAPSPKLTTVFAAVPDLGPQYVIHVDAPCGTFQHDQGGPSVEDISCLLFPIFPSLQYDCFFTIGNACKSGADQPLFVITTDQLALAGWENTAVPGDYFDGAPALTLYNTAFSRLPTDPLTNPGPDGRIRIGRFTSCGELCLQYAIQYFNNYTGSGSQFETAIQSPCFPHPCQSFPMDTTPTLGAGGCNGGNAVELDQGGYGGVTYDVYSGSIVGQGTLIDTYADEEEGLVIPSLNTGFYYIAMQDEAGCRDTTAVFQISNASAVSLDVNLLQDNLCSGDNTASLQVNCVGGAQPVSLTINGNPATCGTTLNNLTCGPHVINVTDADGCTDTATITVSCPAALVANLAGTAPSCTAGGSITGTVGGGTGMITIQATLNNNVVNTVTGTGNVVVNFTNLQPGTYVVSWTDANGCGGAQTITLSSGAQFTATPTETPASCASSCNGTVVFNIVGGTAPFTTLVLDSGSNTANPSALCPGNYTYTITDGSGCVVNGNLSIGSPPQIVSQINLVPETCNGQCNGQIQVFNTTGGFGGYTYILSPNTGLCTAPCSGPSATFTNLCGGIYSVTVVDQQGCSRLFAGLNVVSPPAITVNLAAQNITCNGLANGSVTVTATGGTGTLSMAPGGQPLPFTQSNLPPGTASFTVQDANGCTSNADVVITQPPALDVNLVGTTNVTCSGNCNGNIQYTVAGGVGPYSYQLLPGGTSGAASGIVGSLCAGVYELVITDMNSCRDTLDFDITQPAPLFINVLLDAPTCTGMTDGSALILVGGGTGNIITVIDPNTLQLAPSAPGTFNLINLGETSFTVTIRDGNNCTLQQTVVVVPDIISDMEISTFSSPETCWNQLDGTATIAVQNGFPPIAFLWSDSRQQTTPVATGLASNETYFVVVTDAIGCTMSTEVYVEPTIGCLFITNALTPNGDGANDEWIIGGLEYFPNAKVQVFNRWGQVVFESTGYPSPWNGNYKGERLPVADYYYVIDYSKEFPPITGTVTIKY